MLVNNARSVSEALYNGLHYLRVNGIESPSRNGPVLVMPQPVMTAYHNPRNRVLFSPVRDANPFFHVMESLWMLAGRNDLPWLAQFNKRMAEYSDDGGATQPAAYGYRWRNYFGYDQLETIIVELKNNPTTRRAVLAMWDGGRTEDLVNNNQEHQWLTHGDLMNAISGSKDVPCNTHCYFRVVNGKLNMTVTCRSNDVWWGAHGANAVHFSFLHEYVASMSGIPMGVLYQFSNDYHLYTDIVPREQLGVIALNLAETDRYHKADLMKTPVHPPLRFVDLIDPALWGSTSLEPLADIQAFCNDYTNTGSGAVPFLQSVAFPMWEAWQGHKAKKYADAIHMAERIRDEAWRIASIEWLQRREAKHVAN